MTGDAPEAPEFRHRRESIVFEPEVAQGSLLVEGYGSGYFKVASRRIESAIVLQARSVRELAARSLDDLVQYDPRDWFADEKPEILFLGTGKRFDLPPKALKDLYADAGITLEPMDTGAAARTYNVLLIEGRRVAALMLPVDEQA